MKIIWTVIALGAVAALFTVYESNRPADDSLELQVKSYCKDSYPSVVTPLPSEEGHTRFKVNCKPDRFIRKGVTEHVL